MPINLERKSTMEPKQELPERKDRKFKPKRKRTRAALVGLSGLALTVSAGCSAINADNSEPKVPAPIEQVNNYEGDPATSVGDALKTLAYVSVGDIVDRTSADDVTPYSTAHEFGYKIPRPNSKNNLANRASVTLNDNGEILISTNIDIGDLREMSTRFTMPLPPEAIKYFDGNPLTATKIQSIMDIVNSKPGAPIEFLCMEKDSVDNPKAHQQTSLDAVYTFDPSSDSAFAQYSEGTVVVSSNTIDSESEARDAIEEARSCIQLP